MMRRFSAKCVLSVSLIGIFPGSFCATAQAQVVPGANPGEKTKDALPGISVVVAQVGIAPITSGEVQNAIERLGLPPAKDLADDSWKQGLAHVMGRELAMLQLTELKRVASADDVDEAIARETRKLKEQGTTLNSYLKQKKLDAAAFRREMNWEISWQKYLAAQRTDKALRAYFDRHRSQFDGTSLRISQIFWKPLDVPSLEALAERQKEVQKVLAAIQDRTQTFQEAAQKYSQSPSGKEGGDIGWIQRKEPMPEEISAAAYALKVDEVSEPITSKLGTHLIVVTEQKAGTKTWEDCRDELEVAVGSYLLKYLREQGIKRAKEQGIKPEVIPVEKLAR